MIFLTGLVLFLYAQWARSVLRSMGLWSLGTSRRSDGLVLWPFFIGFALMAYSVIAWIVETLP